MAGGASRDAKKKRNIHLNLKKPLSLSRLLAGRGKKRIPLNTKKYPKNMASRFDNLSIIDSDQMTRDQVTRDAHDFADRMYTTWTLAAPIDDRFRALLATFTLEMVRERVVKAFNGEELECITVQPVDDMLQTGNEVNHAESSKD